MKQNILGHIIQKANSGRKMLAVLIDPDNSNEEYIKEVIARSSKVDLFLVGGSLVVSSNFTACISHIKKLTATPIVIFPGNNMHVDYSADGILFISLISGRNPEFLIGHQVLAAPLLKRSKLEIIPTGYMLVSSGKETTVSYMSNTTPIPDQKPTIALCTAIAGEMLGFKMIFMDAGSGADKPIRAKTIRQVKGGINIPLIIGGGIDSKAKAKETYDAGADLIVIGNGVEKQPELIQEVSSLLD